MDSSPFSLWDSRFDSCLNNNDEQHIATDVSRASGDGVGIGAVFAAAGNDLPFIPLRRLAREIQLGRGGTFQVTRETLRAGPEDAPHYVAVKRVITRSESTKEFQNRLANVLREVRVLREPSLRSHPCIITPLGFGWSADHWHGSSPYLVMEYCDHGTLAEYLDRCKTTFQERQGFALDVALALECLHSHGIVHGDVKQANVLVSDKYILPEDEDRVDGGGLRPQIAKLADFGNVIFKRDIELHKDVSYLGTTKYNAPEIRGHTTSGCPDNKTSFELYKAADCYSFGLLIWEVARVGASFIHSSRPGDTYEDEINRLYLRGKDMALKHAVMFLESWGNVLDELHVDVKTANIFKNTCILCLKDDPLQRGDIQQIVHAISQGTGKYRTIAPYPPTKINPCHWKVPEVETVPFRDYNQTSFFLKRLHTVGTTSKHLSIRILEKDEPSDPSLQVVKFVARNPFDTSTMVSQTHSDEDLTNMFQASMNVPPPWNIQSHVANDLKKASTAGQTPGRKAYAHLQLSIIYMIGYGVFPHAVHSFAHLVEASSTNSIARSILRGVLPAFEADVKQPGSTFLSDLWMFEGRLGSRYVCDLITSGHALLAKDESDGSEDDWVVVGLQFGSIEVSSFGTLRAGLHVGSYSQEEVFDGFVEACKQGNLTGATTFAYACADFGPFETPRPNPLHWLIKFNSSDACSILQTVLSGPDGDSMSRRDGCLTMLASRSGNRLILPERSLEVFGTPLHWAVAAGYEELVTAYINLGADINARLEGPVPRFGEQSLMRYPSFSPLDLAVAYHHDRITKLLLDSGSQTYGGDGQWMHSAFHTIGIDLVPFARYVAHGAKFREALQNTIRVLVGHGLDINGLDNMVQTPLVGAVQSINAEAYIIEELISAGAREHEACEADYGSTLSLAARSSMYRYPYKKARLVLPLVRDLNALDPEGQTALHYCALHGGGKVADEILRAPGINVDARNSSGFTALQLAAARGSVPMLQKLRIAGADLELPVTSNSGATPGAGMTALELATSCSQEDATTELVRAGANTRFRLKDGVPTANVLHAAIYSNFLNRSCVKRLLVVCPELHNTELVDEFNLNGMTPLLHAVYYGDVDGVSALLEAGADHLRHKHPPQMSLGGTPLQLVNETIRLTTQSGEIPEVPSVRETGKAGANEYLARLSDIKAILIRRSKTDDVKQEAT